MKESFSKIADPYPEEDDVRFCELLLKYFKGVIPEPLQSRLKENIPMGAWSIFCTPESFMNIPANPIFPDDKKNSLENEETQGTLASGFQSSQEDATSSSQASQNSSLETEAQSSSSTSRSSSSVAQEKFISNSKYDPIKAVERLKKNYEKGSTKKCATYVRWALEAGMGKAANGPNTAGYPFSAKLYGPVLIQIGYEELNYTPIKFQIGDIIVFQPPYPNPTNEDGHIQMWDGEKWGSDFRQSADFWPGPEYREKRASYNIFRFFITLIFTLMSFANAQNSNADKAISLLDALYKSNMVWGKELDFGNKKETSKYFSSEMVELLYLEEKCLKETGEICRINWVILCNCQDYSDKFSVKFETKSAKPIQILAKISDLGYESEILFNFVEESGMLKISDMLRNGEYSLKKILKEAYP